MDPLEEAQRQANEASDRNRRLRSVFLERGVAQYIQEIADEHRRKIGGGARPPQGDRED